MADSIVRVPEGHFDQDFIAFSFNGKHSYKDFSLTRTSDGSRYNENINPNLEDITVDVPGSDGSYYFGTTHKQRNFNVSFAFDHLTEAKLRELKTWLNGKEMGDLWFSESPYKIWTAKITGNATLKYLPFEENGVRIYKGEGTVQFVAYWPYAHTPDYVVGETINLQPNTKFVIDRPIKGQYFYIEGATITQLNSMTFYSGDTALTKTRNDFIISFANEVSIDGIMATSEAAIKIYKTSSADKGGATDASRVLQQYYINGKKIYAYNQFDTKNEWAVTSGLTDTASICTGENPGDIPATFVLSKTGKVTKDTSFTVENTIKILEDCVNLEWDSKTGIVSGEVNGARRPLHYSGTSTCCISVNGAKNIYLNGATLNYHYWYY